MDDILKLLLTEVMTLMPVHSLSRALIKLCPYQSICDTDGSDSDENKNGETAGISEKGECKLFKTRFHQCFTATLAIREALRRMQIDIH